MAEPTAVRTRAVPLLPILAATLVTLFDPTTAAGQEPSRLVTLLPRQAPVFLEMPTATAPGAGEGEESEDGALARLILPPEVLAACRSDLSDLRLFDRAGREIPFLLDRGPALETRLELQRSVRLEVLETEQTTTERSATRADAGPPIYRERYLLEIPRETLGGEGSGGEDPEGWELEVETPVPKFVRRLRVRVLRRAGDLELMDDPALFRLADPARERVRFALTGWTPARGDRLEVVIEGEEDGYLSPLFRLETTRPIGDPRQARVPLEAIERWTVEVLEGPGASGRQTVIELRRPRGLVPETLRLTTPASGFARPVTVWDDGPGSRDQPLGRGTVYRVRGLGEQLEIPLLRPPLGDRLRLVIEDADGPPIEDLQVAAVVRGPALIFEPPAGSFNVAGSAPADPASAGTPIATLRYGGGRVHRPQYGLARLAPELPAAGVAARRALTFYDPARLVTARLGGSEANPDFDGRPALAFAMRPGAVLDPALYRYRRALQPRPSPEGLHRLPLELADLAVTRPDLTDLRVVDGDDRQWAYLLDRDGDRLTRPLTVEGPDSEDGRSRYRLLFPTAPATADRLVLDSPLPFFDRDFRLIGYRDPDDETGVLLARDRLVRRAGDPRPVGIGFAATRLHHLELEVTDGDDAPLPWSRAEARFPTAVVYFVADPERSYRLLLGEPEAERPRYELERVREVVLAVESRTVETGPLETNSDFRRGARLGTWRGLQRVALWVALGLAVALLGGLTLKLARQESGTGETKGKGSDRDP